MNIEIILEEIYRFYPRNIDPFDEAYDLAPETINKQIAIRDRKAQVQEQWIQLMSDIQASYPSLPVIDDTPIFDRDFCNYCHFTSKTFRIHVIVSLLVHVHTILISYYTKDAQKLLFTADFEDAELILRDNGINDVVMNDEPQVLDKLIRQIFQTEYVKKKDMDAVLVSGVGIQNPPRGGVTLFALAFSSYLVEF